ncbi:MAG TPA: flippase-like domain-containing protein, partial [Candidatus Poseidoniales archaeon]|nr:flippase-like domain-containing protein [Candidatus Poseidoniales archaeon]
MGNIFFLIKIVITGIFFTLIFNNFGINKSLHLLNDFKLEYYFLALLILLVQVAVATTRWRLVLENINLNFDFKSLLGYFWVGLFFNQALPSSIGGDSIRGYYLYKKSNCIESATIGVFLDRLVGIIGLLILITSTFPLFFYRLDNQVALWGVVIVSLGTMCLLVLILMLDLFPRVFINWRVIRGLYEF